MEKRALDRCFTAVPVACCRFSILDGTATHEGTMLNCSCGGSYVELDRPIDEGTIVMLKSSGVSDDRTSSVLPEGYRSVSLAEVRWAKVIDEDFMYRFGLGLKYLDLQR